MPYEPTIELTLAENWVDPAASWAMPGEVLVLSTEDSRAYASGWSDIRSDYGMKEVIPFSQDVDDWIDETINAFGSAVFLRTGIGMAKECPFAYAPIGSISEAISLLRWPDRRLGRYARARLEAADPVSLVIRPWIDIRPEQEFRVFVDQRRIVGACPAFPEKYASSEQLDNGILTQAIGMLISSATEDLPLTSYVADVYVTQGGLAKLIEINPFIPSTDGLLFSWHGGDMDGTFRGTGSDLVNRESART